MVIVITVNDTHLASKTKAIIPAPCGADADVPVKYWVHSLCRSALICKIQPVKLAPKYSEKKSIINRQHKNKILNPQKNSKYKFSHHKKEF